MYIPEHPNLDKVSVDHIKHKKYYTNKVNWLKWDKKFVVK